MNKIFKVIWNPATGSYSVASETAKSRGKKSGRSQAINFCTGCGWNVFVVWGIGECPEMTTVRVLITVVDQLATAGLL